MENRELGEKPKRTHHCMIELLRMPLGNWEGAASDDVEPGDLPVKDLVNEGKVHYLFVFLTLIEVITLISNGLFLFSPTQNDYGGL